MITGGDSAGFGGGAMDKPGKPADRASEPNLVNQVDMRDFTKDLGDVLGQGATHVPELVVGKPAADAGKVEINSLVDMYKNAQTMNQLTEKALQPNSTRETVQKAITHSDQSAKAVTGYVAQLEKKIKTEESLV